GTRPGDNYVRPVWSWRASRWCPDRLHTPPDGSHPRTAVWGPSGRASQAQRYGERPQGGRAPDMAPTHELSADTDGGTHVVDGFTGPFPGALDVGLQDVVDLPRIRHEFLVAFPFGCEFGVEHLEQRVLEVAPSHTAGFQTFTHICGRLGVGEVREQLEGERGIGVLGFLDRCGVCGDTADGLLQL